MKVVELTATDKVVDEVATGKQTLPEYPPKLLRKLRKASMRQDFIKAAKSAGIPRKEIDWHIRHAEQPKLSVKQAHAHYVRTLHYWMD